MVTKERMAVVDFSEPFLSLRSSALLRKPKGGKRQRQQRITNSQSLLDSNITFGVITNSIGHRILATSSESKNHAIWERMVSFGKSALVRSLEEGVDRSLREKYAFILDSPMAEYKASRKPCDFYATEPFLEVMTYAFVLRPDEFRLRQMVDRELKKMKHSDEMQSLYLRWWRDECNGYSRNSDDTFETDINRRYANMNSSPNQSSGDRDMKNTVPTILGFCFVISTHFVTT